MNLSSGEFKPLYDINISNATKNGETVEFQVETNRNNDDDRTIVRRVFEDFAWFLHCLQSQDNVVGIIVRNHIL